MSEWAIDKKYERRGEKWGEEKNGGNREKITRLGVQERSAAVFV